MKQPKKPFVKALGDSFSDIGFAIVSNHGVPDDLIDNAYRILSGVFCPAG